MANSIASPCIKVCTIEPNSSICLGCYRTLPEIARWAAMTDAERESIMAGLEGRMTRLPTIFQRPQSA